MYMLQQTSAASSGQCIQVAADLSAGSMHMHHRMYGIQVKADLGIVQGKLCEAVAGCILSREQPSRGAPLHCGINSYQPALKQKQPDHTYDASLLQAYSQRKDYVFDTTIKHSKSCA